MAELKKKIQPVSNWVTFKLKTDKLEPPEIKLKLAPVNRYIESTTMVQRAGATKRMTQAVVNAILNSIVDWDITENGEKIELTDENIAGVMIPLLGEVIQGTKRMLLGFKIFEYISNEENFLKN